MKSSRRVAWPLAMGNEYDFFFLLKTKCVELELIECVCHCARIDIFSKYDNRWSKTMLGYGPESSHFHVELIYNYGVSSYDLGTTFSNKNESSTMNIM